MKAGVLGLSPAIFIYLQVSQAQIPVCIWGSKTPEVPLFLVFERDLDTREQIYLGCQKQPTTGFEAPTPIIPWWLGAILRSEGRGLWNCIVLKPWYCMCLGILDPSYVLVIRGRAGVRRQSPDAFGCRFVIYKS